MRIVNLLIKPASSLCNLRCRYCFYEDEAQNRMVPSAGIMSREMGERLIQWAFEAAEPGGSVSFAFQGGEPTLAGLDFYRFFTERVKALKPGNLRCSFSMQTNGFVIDEAWARFFREEHFLVGISVDGFKDLHNAHRKDASGKNTWNRILKSVEILHREKVEVNALCVVTGQCARSAGKSYESLKKLGFQYIQYIACLDPLGVERGSMPWSLTPKAYGRFLCELFDVWYQDWEHGNYHSIRLFDDYIHLLLGVPGSSCAACGQCGSYLVAEADGSLYPCDFFSLDEWTLGKFTEQPFDAVISGDGYRRFQEQSRQRPEECRTCPWQPLCNGGCPNDRFRDADGVHNYYCASFRMLLEHAIPRMQRIARTQI